MDLSSLSKLPPVTFFILFVWSTLWKGIALWRSSKSGQLKWFIAILLLNTVGILEITYLFYFSKNKLKLEDLKIWKRF